MDIFPERINFRKFLKEKVRFRILIRSLNLENIPIRNLVPPWSEGTAQVKGDCQKKWVQADIDHVVWSAISFFSCWRFEDLGSFSFSRESVEGIIKNGILIRNPILLDKGRKNRFSKKERL